MMFCFTCYYLISQSSIVDLSFGNSGKIITDFEQQNDQFESVLFLKDSSFIQYGTSEKGALNYIALSKNTKDGAIDVNFGNNGKLLIRAEISYFKLFEWDGDKIQIIALMKVGIKFNLLLIRLNSNGSMDMNFSDDGVLVIENFVNNEFYSVAELSRVSSTSQQFLFYVKGSDANFSKIRGTLKLIDLNNLMIRDYSNISETDIPEVGLESYLVHQNSIYKVMQYNYNSLVIKKYRLNGKVDNNFGPNSTLKIVIPVNVPICCFNFLSNSMLAYSNSEILLLTNGEKSENNIYTKNISLIKFDTLGNHDKRFGISGILTLDSSRNQFYFYFHPSMTIQNEKIFISISRIQVTSVISKLLRIDAFGKIDNNFPFNGKYPTDFHFGDSIFFYPRFVRIVNNKLYIGSIFDNKEKSMDFFLARFNLNPVPTLIKSENFSRKLFIQNNPITEELNLRFKDEVLSEDSQLQIIDMNSNILHTEKIRAIDFNSELKVDLSFIPSGQYIVCLRNSKGNYHNKFIKL
jgi:hypothetical protein